MAVRENGYCTSFILMSAQLGLEGIQGDEPLSPFHFHCWEGDRVEGEEELRPCSKREGPLSASRHGLVSMV